MPGAPQYRVTAKGEHVMSYKMFKSVSVYHVLSTLNKMGTRPSKLKHGPHKTEKE